MAKTKKEISQKTATHLSLHLNFSWLVCCCCYITASRQQQPHQKHFELFLCDGIKTTAKYTLKSADLNTKKRESITFLYNIFKIQQWNRNITHTLYKWKSRWMKNCVWLRQLSFVDLFAADLWILHVFIVPKREMNSLLRSWFLLKKKAFEILTAMRWKSMTFIIFK